MAALRDEGKIGGVGVSTVSLQEVETALALRRDRLRAERLQPGRPVRRGGLQLCARHGVAYVPYFPLGSAFPGMAKVADLPAVRSVAERLGVTPAQVGLAWLLARAPNILLIPGTSSVDHLEQNLAVGAIELTRRTSPSWRARRPSLSHAA